MGDDVHVLRFVSGKYQGDEFPLIPADGGYVIGRSSEVDLVLADDSVSRKHARFYFERGRTWLRDLGSRNGTTINGSGQRHHCLREGDRIAIGSSLLAVATVDAIQATKLKRGGEKSGRSRAQPEDSSSRSMSGSLEDIPLVDVLQWLGTSRKTGTLNVRRTDQSQVGKISLRDGYAFYASIDGIKGLDPEKAMMRMLAWSQGSFSLDNSVIEDVPKEIQTSLEHVLMESARQEDEVQHLSEKTKIPKYEDEIRVVSPSPVRWRDLEPLHLDILQDVDERAGQWSYILDHYTQTDLVLLRAVVAMRKLGIVDFG
jgi:pSer/pThr/pTyr-binding forkhead associated (FHA) protein